MASISGDVLLAPGQVIKPQVTSNMAMELIRNYFGFNVKRITELDGYDDKNFLVEVELDNDLTTVDIPVKTSNKFVFKVLNSLESAKPHVQVQNEVMTFLSSRGVSCPVPQKSLTPSGSTCPLVQIPVFLDAENNPSESGDKCCHHVIRLLAFVEGRILDSIKITVELLADVGEYSAQLITFLEDFHHPALESHRTIWSLNSIPHISKFLYVIQGETERYNLISEVLAAFESKVISAYPQLRKGTIHGDVNEQNLVVNTIFNKNGDEVSILNGIIDFGDMQYSYYLFELAIATCYMMLQCLKADLDPLEGSAHVLKGFLKIREIPILELCLLRICIAARLSQSLVLGRYTHSLYPSNQYLLTTASKGWELLDRVWKITDVQLYNTWKKFIPELPLVEF